jgi:ditrans,polycis-polyprenyl diphosphate synthase
MPSAFGHEAGRRALEDTVRLSRAWGIRALTAFAFSHENWSRPKVHRSTWLWRGARLSTPSGLHSVLDFDCFSNLQLEVDFLMGLFERVINDSVAEFLR